MSRNPKSRTTSMPSVTSPGCVEPGAGRPAGPPAGAPIRQALPPRSWAPCWIAFRSSSRSAGRSLLRNRQRDQLGHRRGCAVAGDVVDEPQQVLDCGSSNVLRWASRNAGRRPRCARRSRRRRCRAGRARSGSGRRARGQTSPVLQLVAQRDAGDVDQVRVVRRRSTGAARATAGC